MDLEGSLAKIRPHSSSSLAHQKSPATLLNAIESTFKEQNTERSPTAYFAALITTLEGTIQKERVTDLSLGEGDVLPAELYLLALVTPFVPSPIIRAHLNTVLSLTAPLFPELIPHAPPLRSQLTFFGSLVQALDRPQLETPTVRQSFVTILQLCLDARPKVRKKAGEVVRNVLASPPIPLSIHPYADKVAEWTLSSLAAVNGGVLGKSKGKKPDTDVTEVAIHLLAFLRPNIRHLPPSMLPSIGTSLLSLPRLGNPYLSESAYSVISELISDDESNVQAQIPELLRAIVSSPPTKVDTTLSPAWLDVVGKLMHAYSISDPDACASELGRVWKAVWGFLESSDTSIQKATATSLCMLAKCFTVSLINPAVEEASKGEYKSTLGMIILQVDKSLDSLAFARAMPNLLWLLSTIISNLRYRGGLRMSPTAAESLLLPSIQKVGDLRTKKGFEYKESADTVLGTAMRVIGPEVLFRVLPLNLEPADRQAGREPRAYLLPLLSQPHPSPLKHFVSYFVPLTERLFDLQQKAESEGRHSEGKVWSVLVAQIWTGLPGYCWGTPDLTEALTPAFAQLLSQLLYNQVELRAPVLKALKIMVESNVALASLDGGGTTSVTQGETISTAEAAQNVALLRSQAESWLAVLFNVFGTVGRDSRGPIGDVIGALAAIAGDQEMRKTYRKVVDLFKQNLAKPRSLKDGENGSVTATTQDLLFTLLPYLGTVEASSFFELCLSDDVLASKDNGVQKRGYKSLSKLVQDSRVAIDADRILKRLEEASDNALAAAKKDRFNLLANIVPLLSPASMHLITSLVPEAVLGTKEPSEKARTAAFDLIVAMGKKMGEGGVVRRDNVDGMDEDGTIEATASVEEYLTMVAGGLAGASPHMISATVTAISRLVFEFKDSLSSQMQIEIFTTLLVFLSSTNREIVKSTLGFIKLSIHTLPVDVMHPHLKQLVSALLSWSGDHKNHFKVKVRHIFERMIRKFGWDDVYACVGEEEAGKVLVNIKKRKERAKRKRARGPAEEDDHDEIPTSKHVVGDAFEDVLYGSESDLDESDDDEVHARPTAASKRKGKNNGARLRVDDDEPMDLLQGAASHITNSNLNRRRKPGQDAVYFKTDGETGKMMIDDEPELDADADGARARRDLAGAAYHESLTSADGFTRGPNGRVKFNKDTKKRRRENEDANAGSDVEMANADAMTIGIGAKKAKGRSDVKLGREFKAKNAGGDVKKGGVDPYAYLPLSQAAKRNARGSQGRVSITGKR